MVKEKKDPGGVSIYILFIVEIYFFLKFRWKSLSQTMFPLKLIQIIDIN